MEDDIRFQAERVAKFDGVKRYLCKTAETFPNGEHVLAIRLQIREGDEVIHQTWHGTKTYDEAVAEEGREAVHSRLAR